MTVRVTAIAQAEIDSAAAWYEGQEDGLGGKFLDRIEEALERICRNPGGRYQKVLGENRRCNVERFPYALAKERAAGVTSIRLPACPPEPS
ncbi:MAG: hypothetical protein JO033_19995 [Acidobacteriaceae bacterium]|nr:hypothetical protein [Acidobacteriaceae bacterium]MBV9500426.1 hypothetical protein [Acidobacteriaceae bacterium]